MNATRNWKTITGPSGMSEQVVTISELRPGDVWMGSKLLEISPTASGKNYLTVWALLDGTKSVSIMASSTAYQLRYLELAAA